MQCLILLALFAAFGLLPVSAAELTVFAAASLSDALTDIATAYHAASGDSIRFNFGASSTLAVQIKHGAPADVFFSADEAKMDTLDQAGLVATDTRRSLLSNTLVIVVSTDGAPAISSPADLAKASFGRIALADAQTVPAGIYAKTYLQKLGLWDKVASKVIPTENVRACLAAVESGNVDAGIVYKTDALISKKVKIAYEIGVNEGPKISYPVAVLKASRQADAARKFARYLGSAPARAAFTRYGFLPVH